MRTKIIYEDKHIVVAYKPAGLATQTARVGQQDMVSELKNYLKSPYLGLVHRLDQPVEGLLVFARDKTAAASLTKQLQQDMLNKQYYAVVCGHPAAERGELVDYLYKAGSAESNGRRKNSTQENRAVIVSAEDAEEIRRTGAKKAVLEYSVLHDTSVPLQTVCMLDIHLKTGRFHQIRAQLSHAGIPILGDDKYGTEASKLLSRELAVDHVALCAYRLQFRHPVTNELMEFTQDPQGQIFQKISREVLR